MEGPIEEKIAIPVSDGKVELIGSIYYNENTPPKTPWIINLLGFMSHRNHWFVKGNTERFVGANYYVLSYDYRAHGETAKKTGKNWLKQIKEIYSDLPEVISWVIETQRDKILNDKIFLFGRSFGGALMLTKGFTDNRIKKIVALCTRYDYATFGRGSFKFSDEDVKFMSPKYHLKKDPSNVGRILIGHCRDDERIPFEANLIPIKEQLDLLDENVLIYDNGGHSFEGNREDVFNKSIEFFKK